MNWARGARKWKYGRAEWVFRVDANREGLDWAMLKAR